MSTAFVVQPEVDFQARKQVFAISLCGEQKNRALHIFCDEEKETK